MKRLIVGLTVLVAMVALTPVGAQGGLVFTVTEASASGPYPQEPVVFEAAVPADPRYPSDLCGPYELLKVSLFNAATRPPPDDGQPIPMQLTGSGRNSSTATVDFGWVQTGPDVQYPAESFFDIFFEVEQSDWIVPYLPEMEPAGTMFDVPLNVFAEDLGAAMHTLHFEISHDQPVLMFSKPVVGRPESPAFHLNFNLINSGSEPVNPNLPLFAMTITADFTPIPEPSTLAIWTLLATLGITVGWWRKRRGRT